MRQKKLENQEILNERERRLTEYLVEQERLKTLKMEKEVEAVQKQIDASESVR